MLVRWSYGRNHPGNRFCLNSCYEHGTRAVAQNALVTALKKKYRLPEINMQGAAANPGTVLTIEADGINAEPYPYDDHLPKPSRGRASETMLRRSRPSQEHKLADPAS